MDKTIRVWDFTSFLDEVLPEWEETGTDSGTEDEDEDEGDENEEEKNESAEMETAMDSSQSYEPGDSFYSSNHGDDR